MRSIQPRRTVLTGTIVRKLYASGGKLGSVRLRMTVERTFTPVPDATWYAVLNRLADDGLITTPYGRYATSSDLQALIEHLLDLSLPLRGSERGIINLTRSGRSYARSQLASATASAER